MQYRVRPDLIFLLLAFVLTRVDAADAPVLEKRVARAAFTTGIVNREPLDRVLVLKSPASEVYFFTDLRNLRGHTVIHRWQYKGETVSRVPFVVDGDRWRVFSRKVLPPDSYGEWSVTVIDDTGWPLYVELFQYEPADTGIDLRETSSSAELGEEIPAISETASPDAPAAAGLPSE